MIEATQPRMDVLPKWVTAKRLASGTEVQGQEHYPAAVRMWQEWQRWANSLLGNLGNLRLDPQGMIDPQKLQYFLFPWQGKARPTSGYIHEQQFHKAYEYFGENVNLLMFSLLNETNGLPIECSIERAQREQGATVTELQFVHKTPAVSRVETKLSCGWEGAPIYLEQRFPYGTFVGRPHRLAHVRDDRVLLRVSALGIKGYKEGYVPGDLEVVNGLIEDQVLRDENTERFPMTEQELTNTLYRVFDLSQFT